MTGDDDVTIALFGSWRTAFASLSGSSAARRWRSKSCARPWTSHAQKNRPCSCGRRWRAISGEGGGRNPGHRPFHLIDRLKGRTRPRRRYHKAQDAAVVPMITALVAARPTYGCRRIAAILNRQLRSEDLALVDHKRVYRIMKAHNLLLARKYSERPEHVHDGKVIVMRSNLRRCSDGFEFTCWNGDVVRGAFIIDAQDREIIS